MGTIEQRFRERCKNLKESLEGYYHEDTEILPVTVLEDTTEAADEYLKSKKSGGCGDQLVILTPEHVKALTKGKALAISPQDEYDIFIVLKQ